MSTLEIRVAALESMYKELKLLYTELKDQVTQIQVNQNTARQAKVN